jgi:hypothetical protein
MFATSQRAVEKVLNCDRLTAGKHHKLSVRISCEIRRTAFKLTRHTLQFVLETLAT